MQEKDAVTNEYFQNPEHFADIVNGFVFEGQPVLEAGDVQERGETISRVTSRKDKVKSQKVILDVVKKVCKGMLVTIIHLQNQTDIHYAMPVRVMNEEAAYYYREWRRSADCHQKERDLKGAEYTSGFGKGEKLISAITIVVYWGRKAWDGPKRLKDMLNVEEYPLELQRFIVDYPIHLLEVRKFQHPEVFQTDMKYVFGFLQRDEDPHALADYVERNRNIFSNLTEGTYNVISKMSHCRELKKVKEQVKTEEEGYDMCQAIKEMVEDGRREGKREGKREGILLGRCEGSAHMLLLVLEKLGEVSEELRKKIYREKDLRVLEAWFQRAISAGSLEEFVKNM